VLGEVDADGAGAEMAYAEGKAHRAGFGIISEAVMGAAFGAIYEAAIADDFRAAHIFCFRIAASKFIVALRLRHQLL
jgi:hypothetical protein